MGCTKESKNRTTSSTATTTPGLHRVIGRCEPATALLPSGLATSEQLCTGCWQSDMPCWCLELSISPGEHPSNSILCLYWDPSERMSGHSPTSPASLTKCSLQPAAFPEGQILELQSSPQADTAGTSQTTRTQNACSQKTHGNKDPSAALVCQSHLLKLFLSSPSCMAAIFGASHNSCDFKIYSELCYQFRQKTLWDFAQYHIHTWSPHKPCSAFRYSSSLVFILRSWLQLFT